MTQVSLENAQTDLADLIARLAPGEGLQITKDGRPIARLVAEGPSRRELRRPGSAIGELVIVEAEPHLDESYRRMAWNEDREDEAIAWAEGTIGDLADEAR